MDMEKELFKNAFSEIAESSGFTSAFGGWYKKSDECLVTLELQRSKFSHLYYLNIHIYVCGYNGETYNGVTKELIQGRKKIFFRREEIEYSQFFNLGNELSDRDRVQGLKRLFENWLVPFVESALSIQGLLNLILDKKLAGSEIIESKLLSLINS